MAPMTLERAATLYPVGCRLAYGGTKSARVLRHERDETGLVWVHVETETGQERVWFADILAGSGVTVDAE
jgi:hypothetical protein